MPFVMMILAFPMTAVTLAFLRVLVELIVIGQLNDMLKLENKALFYARFYRDLCADLQQRCRQLENEKEKVRYFWRNKVLEGQTRSGKILLMATK